jgi:photosystem II stability/assembly factor-like uncharacterized protein
MKKMISLFYIGILFLFYNCKAPVDELVVSGSYSYISYDTDLNSNIRTLYFFSENIGFCTTDSGKVYKTINAGINWTLYNTPTNLPLYDLCFVNGNTGFAIGGQSGTSDNNSIVPGSVVLKTEDGGITWTKQIVPYHWSELHSVSFVNPETGFAVGLGLLIKTTDGGKNWKEFTIDYKGYITKVYFVNSKTGFITGLSGNLFRTSDGGDTWTKIPLNTTVHLYDICFVNEKVGYCGSDPHVFKTTDSGKTWKSLESSATGYSQIHFSTENYGFTIGKGHYTGGDWGTYTTMLTETKDGGMSWTNYDNLEFGSPVCFPTKNIGYAFGTNRKLYKILIK